MAGMLYEWKTLIIVHTVNLFNKPTCKTGCSVNVGIETSGIVSTHVSSGYDSKRTIVKQPTFNKPTCNTGCSVNVGKGTSGIVSTRVSSGYDSKRTTVKQTSDSGVYRPLIFSSFN